MAVPKLFASELFGLLTLLSLVKNCVLLPFNLSNDFIVSVLFGNILDWLYGVYSRGLEWDPDEYGTVGPDGFPDDADWFPDDCADASLRLIYVKIAAARIKIDTTMVFL